MFDFQFDCDSDYITITNLRVTRKEFIVICKMRGYNVEENVAEDIWKKCDKCENGLIKEKKLFTVITTEYGNKIAL